MGYKMNILWWFLYGNMLNEMEVSTIVVTPTEYLIIKIAMIRVNNRLKEGMLKSRLILQIHDELLIEAYESEVDKVMEIVVEEMKNAAQLKVSLSVEAKWGNNWLDAH